jgi:pimeloyl-ACP methyl ester carboxylesterase
LPPITERRRDNQQWILDWLTKTTGRVQNFAYDKRDLPPEVKSYRMIPRVVEKYGRTAESLARQAEQHGHIETARQLYTVAYEYYHTGQHAIFADDDSEKIYLHGKLLECFAKVAELAPHRMEIVEIPFEGNYLQGVFTAAAGPGPHPTVLFVPGMDRTKEVFIDPMANPFVDRGMNCLQIDGPGQGTSNIRKIRITLDNYERAAAACFDWLVERSEVDSDRLAVSGSSFGSYWGMRIAAYDKRVKAVATAAATYGPKQAIFEEASPRFKQVYMYMAGIHDEDEFDRMASQMVLDEVAPEVGCHSLMVVGEYDPLTHLDDALAIYDKVPAPKEVWVVENDFHSPRNRSNFGWIDYYDYLADWIRDVLAGGKPADLDRKVYVRQRNGLGPYADAVPDFRLPGRLDFDGVDGAAPGLTAAQLGPAGISAGAAGGPATGASPNGVRTREGSAR